MTRRTGTRARMLESAAELFAAQGYHATGMSQLLSEGGAPRGSLYFHFPGGKEQLATEAMQLSAAQLHQLFSEVLDSAPDTPTAVEEAAGLLAGMQSAAGFRSGCPLAAVTLDGASASEPIRQACSEGYASWQALLAGHLASQGLAEDRADSLATFVLASIEGALLLATAHQDTAALHTVGQQLRTTVERELSSCVSTT